MTETKPTAPVRCNICGDINDENNIIEYSRDIYGEALGAKKGQACSQCIISPSDYEDAITALEAVNIYNIVATMKNIMERLKPFNLSTSQRNHHPILQLFASKLIELTGMGMGNVTAFSVAYESCKHRSKMNPQELVDYEYAMKATL